MAKLDIFILKLLSSQKSQMVVGSKNAYVFQLKGQILSVWKDQKLISTIAIRDAIVAPRSVKRAIAKFIIMFSENDLAEALEFKDVTKFIGELDI